MRVTFVASQDAAFTDADFESGSVGGSEASLIQLTRALARQGHVAEVFGRSSSEGVFNGVTYANLSRFESAAPFEHLILFRGRFVPFNRAAARTKVFWSTDIDWADWDDFVFPHVDQVLCVSAFHRDFLCRNYRRIEPAKCQVLDLGIVKEDYFDTPSSELPAKPGNRLLYCSVPDRGLVHLARLFPRIRQQVPDAELFITSDFTLWKRAPGNEEHKRLFADMPGVHFLGKVPRRELVELQKSAKVMAYPCTYHEAFCISAMECIAAGALPVTTNDFALKTTVGDGGLLIDGRPGEPAYDDAFVSNAVRLLAEDNYRTLLARRGRERAFQHYTWDVIAEKFIQMLSALPRRAMMRTDEKTETHEAPRLRGPSVELIGAAPGICVVIPVHNQAQYLFRAVSSVLWQLRPEDELIVVDDASTDLGRDCGGLQPFLKRILWLKNDTRRGVSFSRNFAVRRSLAEWIKPLDADDTLAPFALDIIRNARPSLPPHVQVVSGGCHRIHNGRYLDYLIATEETIRNIKHNNPSLPSATFIRRAALLEVGLFDERIDLEEDWDLWLRLHERCGPAAFALTTQPVCYYWLHEAERREKQRAATVDGLPVREYFRRRYGAAPR